MLFLFKPNGMRKICTKRTHLKKNNKKQRVIETTPKMKNQLNTEEKRTPQTREILTRVLLWLHAARTSFALATKGWGGVFFFFACVLCRCSFLYVCLGVTGARVFRRIGMRPRTGGCVVNPFQSVREKTKWGILSNAPKQRAAAENYGNNRSNQMLNRELFLNC